MSCCVCYENPELRSKSGLEMQRARIKLKMDGKTMWSTRLRLSRSSWNIPFLDLKGLVLLSWSFKEKIISQLTFLILQMKWDHRESRRLNIEKKAIKKIITTSKNYQKGKRKSMFIFLMKKWVSSRRHIPKPVQDKKSYLI